MMRQAGSLSYQILDRMQAATVVGVTTGELDELARIELEKAGAIGLSRNYPTYKPGEGFPGYTCISVNEEVVHGIPGPRMIQEGDIVTLDLALSLDGYCTDTATTVGIGKISPIKQRLLDVTSRALDMTIQTMQPGKKWSDVARLMQHYIESSGFSVVREF